MPIIINETTGAVSGVKGTVKITDFYAAELTGRGGKKGLFDEDKHLLNEALMYSDNGFLEKVRNMIDIYSYNECIREWSNGKKKDFLNVQKKMNRKKIMGNETEARVVNINPYIIPYQCLKGTDSLPPLKYYQQYETVFEDSEYRIEIQPIINDFFVLSVSGDRYDPNAQKLVKTKVRGWDCTPYLLIRCTNLQNTGNDSLFVADDKKANTEDYSDKYQVTYLTKWEPYYGKPVQGMISEFWSLVNQVFQYRIPGAQMSMKKAIKDFLEDIKVYEVLAQSAENITENFEDDILEYAKWLIDETARLKGNNKKYATSIISDFVLRLDAMTELNKGNLVSTAILDSLLAVINSGSDAIFDKEAIVSKSLKLLLAERTYVLDKENKAGNLKKVEIPDDVRAKYQLSTNWSVAQKNIILSEESLIIGCAGAGSGKSHTVTGRLNMMKDAGVDMKKVAVFSFTNVAADNISNRFPGVCSETLANMFHSIFMENFPNCVLAKATTLATAVISLDGEEQFIKDVIANGKMTRPEVFAFLAEFARLLEKFNQKGFEKINIARIYADLNELIKDNIDFVGAILKETGLTTLEIEPVILHHHFLKNSPMNIPDKYDNIEHIITDESQDISVFEYIILLEMAAEKKTSLFIVGDGAQTLYEFRNSDPRYMTALEGSGVFCTKTLQTNYRSNQNILNVANKFLQVIDANEHAQIQLKANQFGKAPEFGDSVKLINAAMPSSNNEWCDIIERVIGMKPAVKEILGYVKNDGENLAVLAWTRAEAYAMGNAIEKEAKKAGISNPRIGILIKEKEQNFTLLSETIKMMDWQNLTINTSANHFEWLKNVLVNKRTSKVNAKVAIKMSDRMRSALATLNSDIRYGTTLARFRAGKASHREMVKQIQKSLLDIEAEENKVQDYLSGASQNIDPKKYDILISTIHSAKGLEFDNVILAYNSNKKAAHTQEALRMYFVGLTRAMKREIIISSGETLCSFNATSKQYTSLVRAGLAGLVSNPMNVAVALTVEEMSQDDEGGDVAEVVAPFVGVE